MTKIGILGKSKNMPPKTNAAAKAAFRNRIVAMCQRFSPGTLSMVDEAMEAYAGNEEELIASLVAKYGPEPGDSLFSFHEETDETEDDPETATDDDSEADLQAVAARSNMTTHISITMRPLRRLPLAATTRLFSLQDSPTADVVHTTVAPGTVSPNVTKAPAGIGSPITAPSTGPARASLVITINKTANFSATPFLFDVAARLRIAPADISATSSANPDGTLWVTVAVAATASAATRTTFTTSALSTLRTGMSDCMVDMQRSSDEHLAQLEATVNTWPARQRSPPLATQTFKDSSFG